MFLCFAPLQNFFSFLTNNLLQAKLDALHEQREKEKQEFRNNHVWTFRAEPPEEFNKFNPELKHLFADNTPTRATSENQA